MAEYIKLEDLEDACRIRRNAFIDKLFLWMEFIRSQKLDRF